MVVRAGLTVEGAGVDPTENAARGEKDVHGITEPVRKDEQEQAGDAERLGLEVVDLRQYTKALGQHKPRRGRCRCKEQMTYAPNAENPSPRKKVRKVREGSSGSS